MVHICKTFYKCMESYNVEERPYNDDRTIREGVGRVVLQENRTTSSGVKGRKVI